MRSGFYLKTAWNNLCKNYRFYIPQILTGTGLLACLYIVYTLQADPRIRAIPGGEYIPAFMGIGVAVISLLSVILILYTNSFLMRQRKREYGLYNVLGMEKRHIGRILFWETVLAGGISVLAGSGFGILFYKLASLLICRLFRTEIILGFDFIRSETVLPPIAAFALFYLIAFCINRIGIARMKPVELLKSRERGEKEPRVKWPVLLLGIAALAGGYILSLTTKDPLSAILLFFAAVLLVILGTYCLFTAGSIFVLRALRRSPRFYYHRRHLPGVSGLLYRMKQNAVGLASICILATGVLVMLSTTVSLYSGMQETLDRNYPQDLYLSSEWYASDGTRHPIPGATLTELVRENAAQFHVGVAETEVQEYLSVAYLFDGKRFLTKEEEALTLSDLCEVVYITEPLYTELTGVRLDLAADELAMSMISASLGTTKLPGSTVELHGRVYRVKEILSDFPIESRMAMVRPSGYGIVVRDEEALRAIELAQREAYGAAASERTERVAVTYQDREQASEVGQEMQDALFELLTRYARAQENYGDICESYCESYWEAQEAVIGMYGTLLFLGIILGLVCLFATVLIIYYKQISEGYEDRERYQIMKKVGMSDGEIRQTIRSQTLLVFFLPLLFAGIHTAFAFPMLNTLLHMILLSSTSLFILCTLLTFAVFALIYVLIYSMTAKTYYKIVH